MPAIHRDTSGGAALVALCRYVTAHGNVAKDARLIAAVVLRAFEREPHPNTREGDALARIDLKLAAARLISINIEEQLAELRKEATDGKA